MSLARCLSVRFFLCFFIIFKPWDTGRRSIGKGRSDARRKIGYQGEQKGKRTL